MDKHAGYVSEFTAFINGFLADHPEVVADQSQGYNLWWNKSVDMSRRTEEEQDQVPPRGYVYYDNPPPPDPGAVLKAGKRR